MVFYKKATVMKPKLRHRQRQSPRKPEKVLQATKIAAPRVQTTKQVALAAIRRGGRSDAPPPAQPEAPPVLDTIAAAAPVPEELSYATTESLLADAHAFFSDRGASDRALHNEAMKRLKHMKDVNRRGGDRDGFRFVVPKSVKAMAKHMRGNTGVDNAKLQSTFGGDGVDDSAAKPMKRNKRRKKQFDDFYEFQTVDKWTANAERFLARGRAGKKIFANKRSTKSL